MTIVACPLSFSAFPFLISYSLCCCQVVVSQRFAQTDRGLTVPQCTMHTPKSKPCRAAYLSSRKNYPRYPVQSVVWLFSSARPRDTCYS